MSQGKLNLVKPYNYAHFTKGEKAGMNIDILGISELKWARMGEFNSDDNYTYHCRQECLRSNGVTVIVNKRV